MIVLVNYYPKPIKLNFLVVDVAPYFLILSLKKIYIDCL